MSGVDGRSSPDTVAGGGGAGAPAGETDRALGAWVKGVQGDGPGDESALGQGVKIQSALDKSAEAQNALDKSTEAQSDGGEGAGDKGAEVNSAGGVGAGDKSAKAQSGGGEGAGDKSAKVQSARGEGAGDKSAKAQSAGGEGAGDKSAKAQSAGDEGTEANSTGSEDALDKGSEAHSATPAFADPGDDDLPFPSTPVGPGLPTPPDGGWGWAVVFGCFMIHVIADGVAYSFGVFLEEFLEYFGAGRGATGWLSSLMIGVTWGSGPLVSALTNRFGCRSVTVAGAVVAAIGFWLSIPAPNIYFMYFSFGIVAGLGLSMVYLPSIVAVTFYFEKRRSFATGLAVCGSGIGTFIFAPLTQLLLNYYGSWKPAVLIEGALLLNCMVCGALFRPLLAPRADPIPQIELEDFSDHVANGKQANGDALGGGDGEAKEPLLLGLPTISSTQSLPMTELLAVAAAKGQADGATAAAAAVPNKLLLHPAENHVQRQNSTGMTFSSDFHLHKGKGRGHHQKSTESLGPLARKDIFYRGSLMNIPLYKADPAAYTASITSIPKAVGGGGGGDDSDDDSDASSRAPKKPCCSPAVRHGWSQMTDWSLFKDPVFNMMAVSNLLTSLGFCIPYIFLPDRAKILGFSANQGAFLISIIGISNTVGRIVFGWISDRKGVNRLMLYATVLTLCGISTILSSLCVTYELLALYAAAFGLFLGVYVSLTSVVLVDLLGLEKLTSAFGLILFFQGIGAILGPPIAGWVFDGTGSYDASFWLMGVMLALSGLMLYPVPLVQRWVSRRDQPTARDVAMGKRPTGAPSTGHKHAVTIAEMDVAA